MIDRVNCANCGTLLLNKQGFMYDEHTEKCYCDEQCVDEGLLHEPTELLRRYKNQYVWEVD